MWINRKKFESLLGEINNLYSNVVKESDKIFIENYGILKDPQLTELLTKLFLFRSKLAKFCGKIEALATR